MAAAEAEADEAQIKNQVANKIPTMTEANLLSSASCKGHRTTKIMKDSSTMTSQQELTTSLASHSKSELGNAKGDATAFFCPKFVGSEESAQSQVLQSEMGDDKDRAQRD